MTDADITGADNQVLLRGRLADVAEQRILPSGDEIVSFRLIVDRSATARRRSRQLVDTFDCSVWTARLRTRALKLRVTGSRSVASCGGASPAVAEDCPVASSWTSGPSRGCEPPR